MVPVCGGSNAGNDVRGIYALRFPDQVVLERRARLLGRAEAQAVAVYYRLR